MENGKAPDIFYIVIISERKKKDELLLFLSECGAKVIDTLYGKGSVKANLLMDMLGCLPEKQKAVITCLSSSQGTELIFNGLINKFSFDMPNTGVAYTVPVEKLLY